jgi:hypothetical protein
MGDVYMDVLRVPLDEAKENLVEIIKHVSKEDELKFTTVWVKAKGDTKLLKELTITVVKGVKGEK